MSRVAQAALQILSDIEPFSRHILRKPLRQYQLEPARAILDSILHARGDQFAVMMSRQAGKNETAAQMEAYLLNLFQRSGGQIVKASPTFKPQTVNSLMRLTQHLNNPWNRGKWGKPHGYIVQLGKARCLFFSAHAEANVVGATASILLQADEAQDITATKWSKDFTPMAASTNATRVMWGTAWTSNTLLAQTISSLNRLQAQDGRKRVFLVDWEQVAQEVPAYGDYVRGEIQRLGANHPLIRTQYKLQTIDDQAGLFPAHRQALMRGHHPRRRDPEPGHMYALLIDVAGEEEDAPADGVARSESQRRDATACTMVDIDTASVADPLIARPTYRTVDRRLWIGAKHTSLYSQISALAEHWGARYIVGDDTGVGHGLMSFLAQRFGEQVIPVVFTTKSKSDLGWGFVGIVETGRYQDYADDQAEDTRQFWYEVEACQYESPSPDRLKWGVWETPGYDGLIATGHDDLLISAALTAILDEQPWGVGKSAVIHAPDPIEAYDRGGW
ncbi:MAG: hypothetical protein H8D78_20135 [Chloroflexi bacterium]|nr:hypothetical protein [Chloroflexota bacterium]